MLSKHTQQLYDEVLAIFGDPEISSVELEEDLAEVEQKINRYENVRFEEYLANWIAKQDDDTVLCSCSNSYCHLKRGRIPPKIRQQTISANRDTIDLAREWMLDHEDGKAVRNALSDFQNLESEIQRELRRILSSFDNL